ncbi:MAG TPA: CoA-binding protein [Bacteroidota bacterium]|nr:CoA-binding protein [Bacteroidota bacterium]
MSTRLATIEQFLAGPGIAVVGATDNERKFGSRVYRMMKERAIKVYPVNPGREVVDGDRCYRSVLDIPAEVKSAITVVRPSVTESVIGECAEKGITIVWMQPGSESHEAVNIAQRHGLTVVRRECILMYLEPVESGHAVHRWLKKAIGAYPH